MCEYKKYKVRVYSDRTEWQNEEGQRHREDGPAIEYADGTKAWWLNGQLHREDGPAFEWNDGSRSWYLNGKLHREDGPAIERADRSKEWWLNGRKYSEKEYWAKIGPTKELTVVQIEQLLGHKVKIVKE